MKTLGAKIKSLREERGLKQSSLARDGRNNSVISQIEIGHNKTPGKDVIEHIAKILDVDYEELIKDTDYSPGTVKSGLIAVSDSDFEVKIEDKYNFTIKRNYYLGIIMMVLKISIAQDMVLCLFQIVKIVANL